MTLVVQIQFQRYFHGTCVVSVARQAEGSGQPSCRETLASTQFSSAKRCAHVVGAIQVVGGRQEQAQYTRAVPTLMQLVRHHTDSRPDASALSRPDSNMVT